MGCFEYGVIAEIRYKSISPVFICVLKCRVGSLLMQIFAFTVLSKLKISVQVSKAVDT